MERNPEINDVLITAMEIPKDFLICHSREPSCIGPRTKKNTTSMHSTSWHNAQQASWERWCFKKMGCMAPGSPSGQLGGEVSSDRRYAWRAAKQLNISAQSEGKGVSGSELLNENTSSSEAEWRKPTTITGLMISRVKYPYYPDIIRSQTPRIRAMHGYCLLLFVSSTEVWAHSHMRAGTQATHCPPPVITQGQNFVP